MQLAAHTAKQHDRISVSEEHEKLKNTKRQEPVKVIRDQLQLQSFD